MTKNKKQNREQKKEKKNHTRKKNEVYLLFPNFNLHLIKQKYKSFFKLFLLENILEKLEFF